MMSSLNLAIITGSYCININMLVYSIWIIAHFPKIYNVFLHTNFWTIGNIGVNKNILKCIEEGSNFLFRLPTLVTNLFLC